MGRGRGRRAALSVIHDLVLRRPGSALGSEQEEQTWIAVAGWREGVVSN